VGAAVVPHLPSIAGPFIDDDLPYVANAESVHSLSGALGLFTREYPADGLYRPLTGLIYAVGWTLWGAQPLGFHVLNLALWVLTAFAVDAFARRHLSEGMALATTLLFLAHPAHCEVVDHITGLADLLSSMLLFTALLVSGGPAILLFLLALLAKESAAVLPGLLAVMAVTIAPQRRMIVRLTPYALAIGGWASFKVHAVGSFGPRDVMIQDPNAVSWAATLGAVAWRYAQILFFPIQLAVDRAYRIGVGVHYRFDAPAALGFALVLAVLLAFVLLVRRRPHVAFGIGWALVAMAPYAHVVPFGALMAERFLHTALLGFAWSLVALFATLPAARVLLAAIVATWSARSAFRSADWRDPVSIWAPVVAAHPDDPLAHFALGRIYLESGRTAEARAELEAGLALNPHSGTARNSLGMALLREGDLEGADEQFEAALVEADDRATAMNGRGAVAARRGRLVTARTWFVNALAINPGHEQAKANLRDTDETIARATAARDSSTDPAVLRAACTALEDAACLGRLGPP
jgi:Flp pilus assembly protein TadD